VTRSCRRSVLCDQNADHGHLHALPSKQHISSVFNQDKRVSVLKDFNPSYCFKLSWSIGAIKVKTSLKLRRYSNFVSAVLLF
jgi:hypothetical protein